MPSDDSILQRISHKLDIVIEILQYGQLKRAAEKLKQKAHALKIALGTKPKEK